MLLTLCSSLSLVAFLWFSEFFFFCNSNYHGNIITFSSNNPIKLWPQLNKRNPKRIMKMSTPNFIYPYFFLIKVILLMFYIFIMFSFAILFILPSICFISNHFFIFYLAWSEFVMLCVVEHLVVARLHALKHANCIALNIFLDDWGISCAV